MTSREDEDAATPGWAARQSARDARASRDKTMPLAPPPQLMPMAEIPEPIISVEIHSRTPHGDASNPEYLHKTVFTATGTMQDIAPSLHTIARKYRSPWWAFWSRKGR